MKANKNYGEGVVSYDIFEISNAEMDQMIEMRNRVGEVISNHLTNSDKKIYLSDNELVKVWSILSVLTKDATHRPTSEFEKFSAVMSESDIIDTISRQHS